MNVISTSSSCLYLSFLPLSLSLAVPLLWSSSFFPCEHWCLLQVMNASSFSHSLTLDTLKLTQAVERSGKRNLKIAFGQGFFFSFEKANGCPSLTLLQPRCHSSFTPLFPSSHLPSSLYVQGGKVGYWWLFCRPLYFHTPIHTHTDAHTHTLAPFPPTGHLSFSISPSALTWIMLSPSQNEVRKVMVRHIVQLRLSANGPSIIKGHALADATLCLCVHAFIENRWCYWLSYQLSF